MPSTELRIFVTVGTTRFDSLIATALSEQFLHELAQVETTSKIRLTMQYGKSSIAEILASSSLAEVDDGSQLVPEPGLRVINGRRVYQNRAINIAELDPGKTGTLTGLRIRPSARSRQQVMQMRGDEQGVGDALQDVLEMARAGISGGSDQDISEGGNIEATTVEGIELEMFQFAPNLGEYIRASDVVIGHAGAGTIIETLRTRPRPPTLIAVANTSLMDNHQAELAEALGRDGYLMVGQESRLAQQVKEALLARNQGSLSKFPDFDPTRFRSIVDDLMF